MFKSEQFISIDFDQLANVVGGAEVGATPGTTRAAG